MKKFLLLISVIFVAFQFIGHSQTALEVVWEKTSITRLNKRSILSLMDESITSTGLVLNQLPPCRISVPYCPDSRLLAMTIVLRLLEFFALYTQRQKELQNMDSLTINRTQS